MKSISHYEFINYLSVGTTARVYTARNMNTGEYVACKIIDLQNIMNDLFYSHFKNELIIHSQIRHTGITQLKDVIVDQNNIYVILELCDFGDLNDIVIQTGGLSEARARHYFRHIMGAISYIHSLNVAHRDIKLENILISKDDIAKLTDFGLCKRVTSENTPMLTACGTLVYAAPEILREGSYNGMAADIWSAGIVLYAMVSGHFPWYEDQRLPPEKLTHEISKQILDGNIELPNGTYEIRDLLMNMLANDPSERPSATDVLMHPWMEMDQDYSDGSSTEPDPQLIKLIESIIQNLDERRLSKLGHI